MIGRYRASNNYRGGGQGGPEGQPDLMGVEFELPTAAYESDFRLMNAAGVSADEWGVGDYPTFPHTRPARILSWKAKPWQHVVNGTWGNQSVRRTFCGSISSSWTVVRQQKTSTSGVWRSPQHRGMFSTCTPRKAGSVYRASLDTTFSS